MCVRSACTKKDNICEVPTANCFAAEKPPVAPDLDAQELAGKLGSLNQNPTI